MSEFTPPATRYLSLPDAFAMKRGGELRHTRIAYETWGRPNTAGDNVILILTGLSPSAHAAAHADDASPGWWEGMLGPSKPIDTDRWHVICVNALGSCKGPTGPASPGPDTGEPYRLEFPELSIEDIADAAAYVVRALGFEHLACVIGNSMGGMSALALLARHPGIARSHINIFGAAHALPFSIAIRSLHREAIRLDPHWNQGRFGRLRLDEDRRSHGDSFELEFEVESYLEGHARRFVHNHDPNSNLYLSRCIDSFDLGEGGESADEVLFRLHLEKALSIGVLTDILFPAHQQRQIAEDLRGRHSPLRPTGRKISTRAGNGSGATPSKSPRTALRLPAKYIEA